MNAPTREKSRFLVYSVSAGLIIAIVLLAGIMSIAGAQPDPQKAPFAGVLLEAVPAQAADAAIAVDLGDLGPEWRPVFQEKFEDANWEDKWDVNIDLSEQPKVGLKWGTQLMASDLDPSSTKSAWGICSDPGCSNVDPIDPSYPEGVNSWLVAGPFDLSGADNALINLELFYEANGGDPFTVSLSEDRINFTPQFTKNENVKKGDGEWEEKTVPLASFAGKSQIWIAFTFSSAKNTQKLGALMDNISLWVEGEPGTYLPYIAFGFTPTPPAAPPTATPPPEGQGYETKFTENIEPWHAAFWSWTHSYDLNHATGSDDGREGFLELKVEDARAYVLVSPVIASKAPPYTVEARALIKDKQRGDKYSLVWGGSWDGSACPDPSLATCFNEYYELRVRYNTNGDDRFLEYRLAKVTGHDSDNQPIQDNLIDWSEAEGINSQGWVKWYVDYNDDGNMTVYAEDDYGSGKLKFGSSSSQEFKDNKLFGLIVKTDQDDNTSTRVKFDMFRIE